MSPSPALPHACGLDFGTSNSTLGIVRDGAPVLLPVEGTHVTAPSAVFFGTEPGTQFLFGRAAVEAYVEGQTGRFMRALKSILGSALINEQTSVYRRRLTFAQVIRHYVTALKARAEAVTGGVLTHVVHGRPVHFVDGNEEADRHAEETLRKIAREVGFEEISFQFEPIAAALDHERGISAEEIALIADIGGGTSDFTVVRLSPDRRGKPDRAGDILATGGLRIGGTDFDRYLAMATVMPHLGFRTPQKRGDIDLPSGPYWDLATWSSVDQLYDPKRLTALREIRQSAAEPHRVERLLRLLEARRGHSVLITVEQAKIALSDAERHTLDLGFIEAALATEARRPGFEKVTHRLTDRIGREVAATLGRAGLGAGSIDTVFFTGGTSSIPAVRRAILTGLEGARVVDGDRFGSVGLGLAIEAGRRYGA